MDKGIPFHFSYQNIVWIIVHAHVYFSFIILSISRKDYFNL